FNDQLFERGGRRGFDSLAKIEAVFALRRAQRGVDQGGRALFAALFDQVDRFVDRRVRRDAREKFELIEAEPQRHDDLRIESVERAPRVTLDEEIELDLPAQDAEREFLRQRVVFA